MRMRFIASAWLVAVFTLVGCAQPTRGPVDVQGGSAQQKSQPIQAVDTLLPNAADSLKFGILGDFGTADRGQIEMAAEMGRVHKRFPYELVVTVGDNIYGSERPQDLVRKFEVPYKALLDAG